MTPANCVLGFGGWMTEQGRLNVVLHRGRVGLMLCVEERTGGQGAKLQSRAWPWMSRDGPTTCLIDTSSNNVGTAVSSQAFIVSTPRPLLLPTPSFAPTPSLTHPSHPLSSPPPSPPPQQQATPPSATHSSSPARATCSAARSRSSRPSSRSGSACRRG